MKFVEFKITEAKKLGRTFNHIEDLVFFYGSAGTLEALEHLRDFATQEGANSIRMKWDGMPTFYWGRETANGPLVLTGHNGWGRGSKSTNPEEVYNFIANQSGNPKTAEEKIQRDNFAKQFASLYPLFDDATPKDFVGFVYADGLFLQPQTPKNGVYTFCPNNKSNTCYHVREDSELGKRIANAKAMIVGHAFFPQFGMPDERQQPIKDFSKFNGNSELIVLGPVYNSKTVKVNTDAIDKLEAYVKQYSQKIDGFLESTSGLGDLKNVIYKYVNQTAKLRQLDSLSEQHFFQWLQGSNVSQPKQSKISSLNQQFQGALSSIFELVKMIQRVKDDIIDQLETDQGEIWDTNGEGRVRYADNSKQFGNIKLVPRKRWTPQ